MAFTYGFYNSMNGDRRYNAEQISAIFDGLISDGVYDTIGQMFAVKPGSGMQITVGTGRAWFNHTWNNNDALLPLFLVESDIALPRYDAIVLEVNAGVNYRENTIKVITGTPATNPVKPSLTNTGDIHQHPLAYIRIPGGTTAITEAMIENVVGLSQCPFVTGIIETASIDALFTKWNGEFYDWWDNIKATLNENTVTNLQNQIDARVKTADKATTAEATAGTNNTKWMTPALVKTAIGTAPNTVKDINDGLITDVYGIPSYSEIKTKLTPTKSLNIEYKTSIDNSPVIAFTRGGFLWVLKMGVNNTSTNTRPLGLQRFYQSGVSIKIKDASPILLKNIPNSQYTSSWGFRGFVANSDRFVRIDTMATSFASTGSNTSYVIDAAQSESTDPNTIMVTNSHVGGARVRTIVATTNYLITFYAGQNYITYVSTSNLQNETSTQIPNAIQADTIASNMNYNSAVLGVYNNSIFYVYYGHISISGGTLEIRRLDINSVSSYTITTVQTYTLANSIYEIIPGPTRNGLARCLVRKAASLATGVMTVSFLDNSCNFSSLKYSYTAYSYTRYIGLKDGNDVFITVSNAPSVRQAAIIKVNSSTNALSISYVAPQGDVPIPNSATFEEFQTWDYLSSKNYDDFPSGSNWMMLTSGMLNLATGSIYRYAYRTGLHHYSANDPYYDGLEFPINIIRSSLTFKAAGGIIYPNDTTDTFFTKALPNMVPYLNKSGW